MVLLCDRLAYSFKLGFFNFILFLICEYYCAFGFFFFDNNNIVVLWTLLVAEETRGKSWEF